PPGAGARHATLRACLDWGHELLDAAEQQLLHQFSVFSGTFDLEAAQVVGGRSGVEILQGLTRLVDGSWINVEAGRDGTRFRLTEAVRRYAEHRLHSTGEQFVAARAHRDHYLMVAAGYQ